jgi:hypothetical protein
MEAESRSARRWPQLILGGLIVWQLAYLIVANVVSLIPPPPVGADGQPEPGFYPAEAVRRLTRVWAGLTLQGQYWRLFFYVAPTSSFPAVELTTSAGETVAVHSALEPADPSAYLDLSPCSDRLWHYEAHLNLIYLPWDDSTVAGEPENYREYRIDRVRLYGKPVLAYLQWRVEEYGREHPGSTIREAVFLYRIYKTPGPGERIRACVPQRRPLVRWNPGQLEPDRHPLDAYDPKSRRFVPVLLSR